LIFLSHGSAIFGLQASARWHIFSAELHFYRVDSRHGVGPVLLGSRGGVNAESSVKRGAAFLWVKKC
jgi:hypothetical protein